jgi:hypothetical protein
MTGLRVRGMIVAIELALAILLLSGAGLMVKSFWRLHTHPTGFYPENILKVSLSGPPFRTIREADLRQLLLRLESTPGVQSAGITAIAGMTFRGTPALRPGRVSRFKLNAISEAYPRVMGMRLLKGRWITDSERDKVAIINESAARYLFGEADPIGRTISSPKRLTAPDADTVVGIVADLKYSKLDADPEPQIYVPYPQWMRLPFTPTVVIRTPGDPLAVAPSIRKLISDVFERQVVVEAQSLEQALADSIAPRRFNLFLLGTFAVTALLLALVGIYGVIAYSVTQRTHDISVCMALGAQRRAVVRTVVGQAMSIVLAGIGVGLAAALGLTRLMVSLLYEVQPNDPATLIAVIVALAATALLASWVLRSKPPTSIRPLRCVTSRRVNYTCGSDPAPEKRKFSLHLDSKSSFSGGGSVSMTNVARTFVSALVHDPATPSRTSAQMSLGAADTSVRATPGQNWHFQIDPLPKLHTQASYPSFILTSGSYRHTIVAVPTAQDSPRSLREVFRRHLLRHLRVRFSGGCDESQADFSWISSAAVIGGSFLSGRCSECARSSGPRAGRRDGCQPIGNRGRQGHFVEREHG